MTNVDTPGPAVREPIPPTELVARIEAAFRDVYLTLISIIQGVAFGFLATSAFADPLPDLGQSIAYIACLLAIIVVWQEYMVGSTAFIWTPTLLDSFVPFGVGLVEFLLIASARRTTGAFLACLVLFFAAGVVGYGNWLFHARRGGDLNTRTSYPILGRYVRFGTTVCALDLLAAIGLLGLHHRGTGLSDVAFASAALVLMLPLSLHSIANWSIPLRRINDRPPTARP
ncbi:hypothetical protein WEI85_33275 [Actinomycetes bacterium KLBMP 9797]